MQSDRGHWGSNAGFILAATGSAIGLGNLWRFPYITWENDGGAFVLVYLICIVVVGMPIMMAELLIGRRSQKSTVGALRECAGRWWGVFGIWGVLCASLLLSYYTVIAGWSLYYFARTAAWSVGGYPTGLATGDLFGNQVGNAGLQIFLSLGFSLATVAVVWFGVRDGIEKLARVSLPILFGILLLLFVSALGMSGSGQALGFLFQTSFSELEAGSALSALGHSFFSLSVGMGTMITYGSYLSREQSIVKASAAIVALDTLIAVIASVIMFSVIFSVAGMTEQVGASPVGMLFISLPELFYTEVPFGVLLAPLFYVLVAVAALTSTISLLEVATSYLIDEHALDRRRATAYAGSVIFIFTIFAALSFSGVPFFSTLAVFASKTGWFESADHFVSNVMLPTGGLAITLAAGWFVSRRLSRGELMDGNQPGWFRYEVWLTFIRYVAPAAVLAIIIAVLLGTDFS